MKKHKIILILFIISIIFISIGMLKKEKYNLLGLINSFTLYSENVSYSNTMKTSKTNVQDALNELYVKIDDLECRGSYIKSDETTKSYYCTKHEIDLPTPEKTNTKFLSRNVVYTNNSQNNVQEAIDDLILKINSHDCKDGYIINDETNNKYKCIVPKCKRAVDLHIETCNNTACNDEGYNIGDTIVYGNFASDSSLKSGDAFDCDVNGDGVFDSDTERFYYVSDYYDTTTKEFNDDYAVLIYYTNTTNGKPDSSTTSLINYSNDTDGNRREDGPTVAKTNLPTTDEWSNVNLYKTEKQIIDNKKQDQTLFDYSGYSARLINVFEVQKACNISDSSITNLVERVNKAEEYFGDLDNCPYFLENGKYTDDTKINGYWTDNYLYPTLEYWALRESEPFFQVTMLTNYREINYYSFNNTTFFGVRPVIEVKKTDIEIKNNPSKIELTFISNDKTVKKILHKKGTPLGELPKVERSGYTFIGWFTSKYGGTKITKNTIPSNSTTYYAFWTENPKCKRASTLHTVLCNGTCSSNNKYSSGSTITYGSLGTNGKLTSGDAFDCDVNGDGVYDPETERFYYVSDYYDTDKNSFDNNYAVLIFYTNIAQTTVNDTSTYQYSEGCGNSSDPPNICGPTNAYTYLPSSDSDGWKNIDLIDRKNTRQIRNEQGEITVLNHYDIGSFTYTNKAARFLTTQELQKGCNITSIGTYGELDGCDYLMENTSNYEGRTAPIGYWLETPFSDSGNVSAVHGGPRAIYKYSSSLYGVRPVIELPITKISY